MRGEYKFFEEHKEMLDGFYKELSSYEEIVKHNDNISFFQNASKDYANLAIKYLFLLNGGALIALPAITEAFDITGTPLTAPIFYAAGLVLIILCILLAYFSTTQSIHSISASRNEDYSSFLAKHWKQFYGKNAVDETIENLKSNADKYQEDFKKHHDCSLKLEAWSIFLGLTSLASFIIGSFAFFNYINS